MGIRSGLELQADRIEQVLTMHKVPARVTGGTVTPRWIRFQVLPAMGGDVSKIKGLSEELTAALDVSNCQVLRRGAAVTIEVPRDDPQPVRLPPLYRQLTGDGNDIPPMTAILGLAEDGAPLLIRLPSPDVGNVLVVGNEGAGKTSLLRSILLSLEWANLGANLRNVHIVDDLETCDYARQDGVARLAQQPDEHVIVATGDVGLAQRIGDRFPVRLVGRVTSAEDARAATGWRGTGAERLMGQGDFIAVAEGRVVHFQAAFIGPNELATVPALTVNAVGGGFLR